MSKKTITLEPVVVSSKNKPPEIAHYRIGGLLGKGGMGEVYEAYDGPPGTAWWHSKSSKEPTNKPCKGSCARPKPRPGWTTKHICKVYDAGVKNGQPYIAMQYIKGDTLKEVGPGLSQIEKVRVIRDVALGVHAAHKQGVIHRDLKPGNIMLTNNSGNLKPFVMDFGLARAPSIDSLTAKGALLGTVHYMSPEQAKGNVDDLDRRADVYSLGGTLFYLLAGRSPLEGKSVASILHLLGREGVPSLATFKPDLSRDLIAIVDKCLQRNRGERYPTARALAEDLDRYMEGEAVAALPPTIPYRLGKKVSKHRIVTIAVAASLLILLSSLLWISVNRLRSAERTRLAQSYGQRVERIEALARYTHMLPAHNVLGEYAIIRTRLDQVAQELPMLEDIAVGPGQYALGRGYLVVGDDEKAVTHLASAWKANYRTPEVAYALGLGLARRYQQEALSLMTIRNAESREKRRREIEIEYREPALEYLQMANGLGTESAHYIQSLIDFQRKDYEKALHKAALAFEEIPWLYEALALQGEIHLAMAREALFKGEHTLVAEAFEAATETYSKALEIAGSDPSVYLAVASLWQMRMIAGIHRDDPEIAAYKEAAIDVCRQALVVHPDLAAAHQSIAKIHLRWCEHLNYHGKDMAVALDEASQEVQIALDLEPENADTLNVLGLVSVWRGIYRASIGDDPRYDYQEAISALTKAERARPGDVDTIVRLGLSLGRLGWYEKDHGFDAAASLESANRKYATALELDPGNLSIMMNLATNHAMLAEVNRLAGKDPIPALHKAVAISREIETVNPEFILARANLGKFLEMEARYLLERGQDPSKPLLESIDLLGECVRELPRYFDIRQWLGTAWLTLAHWEFVRGNDPEQDLKRAQSHLQKILENNKASADARFHLASAWQLRRLQRAKLEQSIPAVDEVVALLQSAVDQKPTAGDYLALGMLHCQSAELDIGAGRSPQRNLLKARTALVKGEALKPWDLEIHAGFALLHLLTISNPNHKPSDEAEIEEGLARTSSILDVNPNHARAQFIHALLSHQRAKKRSGAERQKWAARAKTGIAKARNLNPNLELYHPYLSHAALQ